MSPDISSRVMPQLGQSRGFTNLAQGTALTTTQDEIVDIAEERNSDLWPAPKAWVLEREPPTATDELPVDGESILPTAAAKVHYYRQRHAGNGGEPSLLLSWLAGILCLPRTNSGRFGSGRGQGREDSVDSVDFVGTWQRAQAEAAARKVVPAIKRPNEACSLPNTPESAGPASCAVSRRAITSASGAESSCVTGRSTSFLGQRNPSACGMAQSPAPTCDLVQYLDELGQQEGRFLGQASMRSNGRRSVRFY